ncbi:MAG: hypothetical protein IJU44_10310 [Kiritimatiellae bacterium]|nr:hypothetical protein [Kiritimatiellia bacterium]
MEQVLFVLQDGKISQWNLSRGKLEAVKSHGLLQVPYSSKTAKAYWDDWKEDNQIVDGDVYDALFLSGDPNDFGKLPKWICANSKDKSAWTFEQLSLLANEAAFKSTGLCLVQGKVKRLVGTDKADKAVVLQVKSSLAFALPKDAPKPVAKPAPKKESSPKVVELAADCCGNDEKAQSLKAGDRFTGKIANLSSIRDRCFVNSDSLSQQMRILYSNLSKYCQAVKRTFPVLGDTIEFKVLSTSKMPLRIDLKLEIEN